MYLRSRVSPPAGLLLLMRVVFLGIGSSSFIGQIRGTGSVFPIKDPILTRFLEEPFETGEILDLLTHLRRPVPGCTSTTVHLGKAKFGFRGSTPFKLKICVRRSRANRRRHAKAQLQTPSGTYSNDDPISRPRVALPFPWHGVNNSTYLKSL